MALYKESKFIAYSSSDEFDKVYKPGTTTPHSGIYRCTHCGKEDACNQGNPLPPQNHHQHSTSSGSIAWQMVVYAQTKG